MPAPKETSKKKPAPETIAENVTETVVERYLDLWQDNIRFRAIEAPAPPEDKE